MSYSKMDRVFPILSQRKTGQIIGEILKDIYGGKISSAAWLENIAVSYRSKFSQGNAASLKKDIARAGQPDMACVDK